MGGFEAQAGGIVLVFQEVRRGDRQHVAGDPAADERSVSARIA
jgi:hypothetical protein